MAPSKIGPRYLSYVLRYIADSNALGADVAWDFFQLNWEKISNMWVLITVMVLIVLGKRPSRFPSRKNVRTPTIPSCLRPRSRSKTSNSQISVPRWGNDQNVKVAALCSQDKMRHLRSILYLLTKKKKLTSNGTTYSANKNPLNPECRLKNCNLWSTRWRTYYGLPRYWEPLTSSRWLPFWTPSWILPKIRNCQKPLKIGIFWYLTWRIWHNSTFCSFLLTFFAFFS